MRNGSESFFMSAPPELPYLAPERAADAGLLETERLGIAAATCSEISRLVVSELEISVNGPVDRERAESVIRNSVEAACRCGEVILKPYFAPGSDGRPGIEVIRPDRYRVIRRDPTGTPTVTEFVSGAVRDGRLYKRRELHELRGNVYVITNSVTSEDVSSGRIARAQPGDVTDWEGISPKVRIGNVTAPLFSVFRATPDGAPLFRRGRKLIDEIEKQYDRLIWEYEGGELAIDASLDAFRIGRDGRPELPQGKERLWRTNMLDACSSQSELLKIYNPELRDGSYIRGLNRMLMHYEDAVGVARGTFSDPVAAARSATEVRSTRQKTFSLADEVRKGLFSALGGLTYALDTLCVLYRGDTPGGFGISVKYGDGLTDGRTRTRGFGADR